MLWNSTGKMSLPKFYNFFGTRKIPPIQKRISKLELDLSLQGPDFADCGLFKVLCYLSKSRPKLTPLKKGANSKTCRREHKKRHA